MKKKLKLTSTRTITVVLSAIVADKVVTLPHFLGKQLASKK